MDAGLLSTNVAVLAAFSVASERLVDIVKGLFPALDQKSSDAKREGWRRAALQALAVAAGIVTAAVARDSLPEGLGLAVAAETPLGILGVGLMVSGGSGLWNGILAYLRQVKEARKLQTT